MRASVVEIQATRGIPKLGVGELWRFRDLINFFAWRDVKVRYKQTLFGGMAILLRITDLSGNRLHELGY